MVVPASTIYTGILYFFGILLLIIFDNKTVLNILLDIWKIVSQIYLHYCC